MYNLTDCGFTSAQSSVISALYFSTFFILLPIYVSIGLLLNLVLLLAFVEQTKSQTSYSYQLLVVASKTFENLIFGAYQVSAYWLSGMYEDKVDGFRDSYSLLVIGIRVGLFMYCFSIYNSLFMSVAMAADRVFAIWRPFVYKAIDRRRHRTVALSVSLVLAFGLCVDYCWYYDVKQKETWYVVATSISYVNSAVSRTMKDLRAPVRVISMISLVVLNVLILIGHKRRMKNLAKIATMNDKDKAQARKESSKELLMLTVCQCCLTFIDQIPNTCMDLVAHASEYWAKCGFAIAPVSNGSIMVSDTMEFVVIIAVNKKMREKVIKVLKRMLCRGEGGNSSQVSPLVNGAQNQG